MEILWWTVVILSIIFTIIIWNIKYEVPKELKKLKKFNDADDIEFLYYTDEFIDHDF